MTWSVMPLPFKPSRLDGLSEGLLAGHYENDYGAALRRLRAAEERLSGPDPAPVRAPGRSALRREALLAANSVILHEIYFDGLGGRGDPHGALAAALERDFGSVGRWRNEFAGTAAALDDGSGWAILAWSPRHGRLTVHPAADDASMLAGSAPVLALDMHAHAYRVEFGADAVDYVDAYLRNVCWDRVGARFARAIAGTSAAPAAEPAGGPGSIGAEALQALLDAGTDVLVLDVCLAEDLAKRSDKVRGALVRAPERIDEWADGLPRDRPIVAYCVYGFQVSGDAVAALRRRGLDARILAGGIAAWHAIGAPTAPLLPGERPG